MRTAPLALVCFAGALAGTALARPGADRSEVTAIPAGPPRDCIPLAAIRETQVRDDRTIDFLMRGRTPQAYRVTLPEGCPELGFERRFAYATSLSQLCSNDIITVLRVAPLMQGASCGLAPFQPVMLPRHAR